MLTAVVLDEKSLGPEDLDLEPLFALCQQWYRFDYADATKTKQRCANADIIITNKCIVNAEIMDAAPQLKLIAVAATGTNNVDLAAAQARGILVCNVAGYGTQTVAQHCIGLILALATQLIAYQQSSRRGNWSKSPFFCLLDHPIVELAGKRLGIIGFGAIGQAVAKLGEALGMEIMIAARPGSTVTPQGRTELTRVIREADVLSLHCPLNEETESLINENALQQMKNSSFLINISRGGLVVEDALAEALRSGQIAGAALDVLSQEPPPLDHPLLAADIPNLILTPHSAWASQEARQRLINIMTDNIAGFIKGAPQNLVSQ